MKRDIDQAATDFGVNIRAVRITDIDTPPALVEELAVIARAECGARAKQIQAEAEVKVAEMLAKAARILDEPVLSKYGRFKRCWRCPRRRARRSSSIRWTASRDR